MSSRRPGLKWYPGDLRRDVALQSCSLAARGLWYEMLWLMHDGEPYGHLAVAGRSLTEGQVAALVGATPAECRRLRTELLAAGVPELREDGCWFSRRMVRDEEIRAARASGGPKGGNPALMGGWKDNLPRSPKDNLPLTGEVNPISRAGAPALPTPSSSVIDSSKLEGVRGNLPPSSHGALETFYREADRPVAFLAELGALASGLRGRVYDWPTIGRALEEMAAAGGGCSPRRLQVFCRKIAEGEPDAKRPPAGGDWMARLDAMTREGADARPE